MRSYYSHKGKAYTGKKRGRRHNPECESQPDKLDEFFERQMHKVFNSLFVTVPFGPPAWTAQQQQIRALRQEQRSETLAPELDVFKFEYRR